MEPKASQYTDEEIALIEELRKKKAASSSSQAASPTKALPILPPSVVDPSEPVISPEKEPSRSASSEHTLSRSLSPAPTKEGSHHSSPSQKSSPIDVELLPTPTAPAQKPGDSQSVAGRVKRRAAKGSSGVPSLQLGETPPAKRAKISPASKGKKPLLSSPTPSSTKMPKLEASLASRHVLEPLIVGTEFWTSTDDESVIAAHAKLQLQGWDSLVPSPFAVNEDMVRLFYQNLQIVSAKEDQPAHDALLTWGGKLYPISAGVIGTVLGLETGEGFGVIIKRNWPGKRKAAILRTVFEGNAPAKGTLFTKQLGLDRKILHTFLIKNVTPRQEKRDTVAVSDAVLLEKLILGEPIDLPRIILAHMQFCKTHSTHGLPYPNVIKLLLSSLGLYPDDIPETHFSHILTMTTVRRLAKKAHIDEVSEAEDFEEELLPGQSDPRLVPDTHVLLNSLAHIEHALVNGFDKVAAAVEKGNHDTHEMVVELWKCTGALAKEIRRLVDDKIAEDRAHRAKGTE